MFLVRGGGMVMGPPATGRSACSLLAAHLNCLAFYDLRGMLCHFEEESDDMPTPGKIAKTGRKTRK
jgi:hypothetical protein